MTPPSARDQPSEHATIQSIALAFPEHEITAAQTEERLRALFGLLGEDPELVAQVVQNSGIERRSLARSQDFYLEQGGLTERNAAYVETARELGARAARQALADAGVAAADVDLVIDTSCTGFMIPALDAYLANELGFSPHVRRLPLTEAGCAAGATALAFASDYLQSKPAAIALIVAVELPSLTLQLQDPRRANLVSAAIFGDGAAAAVVARRPARSVGIEVLAHRPVLFPETESIMGFDLRTEGFQIILSQRIPLLVKRNLRREVDAFLATQGGGEGVELSQLSFFVLHPGGTKVLDNVRDELGLQEEQVASSRACLREHGNLSSASVFGVAHGLLGREGVAPGELGLLIAMGPGFTVELALLRGVAGVG